MGRFLVRWVVIPGVLGIVIFIARLGCGLWRLSHSDAAHEEERAIEEPYRAAAEKFVKAIQRKDYRAAYDGLSAGLRQQGSVTRFADAFRGATIASYTMSAGSKDVTESSLIPEELKPRIREVVEIDLDGPDIDAVLVLYFVDENGDARVARFLID